MWQVFLRSSYISMGFFINSVVLLTGYGFMFRSIDFRGRTSSKFTEEQEDSELIKEDADDGVLQTHRLAVQPSCISFGTMREYQMQGLNWLIHLYDNGINGILADEMVSSCHRC